MAAHIVTTDDLREFKLELLEELKTMLGNSPGPLKRYLKSSEVMAQLEISPGTLQNLRINGTLPYSKIGGIIYYDSEDIQKIMVRHRIHHTYDR
jgi:hypothetical protein